MGQFLQVNGDYNIKAGEGAKITLDTGPASSGGAVTVTGNLIVQGDTVSVAATNLDVSDNIITLNFGETGSGVTLGYSGIQVDRGDLSPASLLYDESLSAWIFANNASPGPFNYTNSNIKISNILTSSTLRNTNFPLENRYGDLTLIGEGTGVVSVFGTTTYEENVTHDDDIPNKKYVDDSILNNPTFQIVAPQSQDTSVIISDKQISPNISTQAGSLAYFTDQTGYSTFGESAVSIVIDSQLIGQFFTNRLEVGGLELGNGNEQNEITTKAGITNSNIYIRTQGTGKLQTNYAVQLERIGTTPAYVSDNVLLYAAQPDIGSTGIWFMNDSIETAKRNGELISKNKALVFSMLF
jgi:hypothetical protein